MRFYYQNRAIILHKKREQYKEKHGTVKKYNFVKPLKEYRYPERKQFRKRRGHIEPILHHYPKNRLRSWSKSEKEGIVVWKIYAELRIENVTERSHNNPCLLST